MFGNYFGELGPCAVASMRLFFSRSEDDEQVVIRYTPTWFYLLITGVLVLLLLSVARLPFDPEPFKQFVFVGYVALFILYYLVTFKTRREIFRAIRERRIKVSGSRFSPKNPLVVTIDK